MQSGSFLKTSAALLAAGPGSRDIHAALLLTASLRNPPLTTPVLKGKGWQPPWSVLPLPSSLLGVKPLARILSRIIENLHLFKKKYSAMRNQHFGEHSRKQPFSIKVGLLIENFKRRGNLGRVQKFFPLW